MKKSNRLYQLINIYLRRLLVESFFPLEKLIKCPTVSILLQLIDIVLVLKMVVKLYDIRMLMTNLVHGLDFSVNLLDHLLAALLF